MLYMNFFFFYGSTIKYFFNEWEATLFLIASFYYFFLNDVTTKTENECCKFVQHKNSLE